MLKRWRVARLCFFGAQGTPFSENSRNLKNTCARPLEKTEKTVENFGQPTKLEKVRGRPLEKTKKSQEN